jgi:hypothetical protein
MAGILTMDGLRKAYPEDRFIHVMPVVTKMVETGEAAYGVDVATVKIDPNDHDLVYSLKASYDQKTRQRITTEVGLQKTAVERIAAAADVSLFAERTDDRSDIGYARFAGIAVLIVPGISKREVVKSVEWESEVEIEKARTEAEAYIDRAIDGKWAGYTQENRDSKIEARFKKEWLAEREFGKRKAQSKAIRNAALSLLGLKAAYPVAELAQKEFAIVKFVLNMDWRDPAMRALLIESGMRAQSMLYPSPGYRGSLPPTEAQKALPAPQEEPIPHKPAHNDPTNPDEEVAFGPVVVAPMLWADALAIVPAISSLILRYNGSDKPAALASFEDCMRDKDTERLKNLHDNLLRRVAKQTDEGSAQ